MCHSIYIHCKPIKFSQWRLLCWNKPKWTAGERQKTSGDCRFLIGWSSAGFIQKRWSEEIPKMVDINLGGFLNLWLMMVNIIWFIYGKNMWLIDGWYMVSNGWSWIHMEVFWVIGVVLIHFERWDFPWNRPSILGIPHLWTPPYSSWLRVKTLPKCPSFRPIPISGVDIPITYEAIALHGIINT